MGKRKVAFEMHTEDTLDKLDTDTTILFKLVADLSRRVTDLEKEMDQHRFGDH